VIRLTLSLLLYGGILWWINDHGRTPAIAMILHTVGRWLRIIALELGALSWSMQVTAAGLIRKRSLA
jgi:hypothetical protein